MAIVVLIVGGLLSILGIAGYIYGLDLMPTERGVAGVISSSVIIVGGVLTLALGLVLRKLEEFGRALGLSELAALPPVAATPAPPAAPGEREPLPTLEDAIAMPTVVPVQPASAPEPLREAAREAVRDLPPVAIVAPKPKSDPLATAPSRFDLPRPSLKSAATVAGVAAAGTMAAKAGLDAVEDALSLDAQASGSAKAAPPKEPAITPLNLPRLNPRAPAPAAEKASLRPHEIEYPVEILAPAGPETPKAAEAGAGIEPALPDYPEVPMPAPETSEADAFDAELERLLPLKPVDVARKAPPMPEVTALEIKIPEVNIPEVREPDVKAPEMVAQDASTAEAKPAAAWAEEVAPVPAKPAGIKPAETKPAEAKPEKRRSAEKAEAKAARPEVEPAPVAETPAAVPPPAETVPADPAPAVPKPAPGAEVVGAYESGGAKYTMYSDGSVIAEAEGQTMFFKSLEELREFIDGPKT